MSWRTNLALGAGAVFSFELRGGREAGRVLIEFGCSRIWRTLVMPSLVIIHQHYASSG